MSSPNSFRLGIESLSTKRLSALASTANPDVLLCDEAKARINYFRQIVLDRLASGETFYGINTGFGFLSEVKIESAKLAELQVNFVRSHASGVGDIADISVIRAMMILRLHTFALGHSGISLEVCQLLCDMLRHNIIPVVPKRGSVGASGDLAPLAHIALSLIGEGEVFFKGERCETMQAFRTSQLKPVVLGAKEGLSITNGTHFMAANAALLVDAATTLIQSADLVAAMSLDAFKGTAVAFDPGIHALKPHPGQLAVSQNISRIFSLPDDIMQSHKECKKIQDPYSFRCVAQVHGASRDVLTFVGQTADRELNSVTDNPLILNDGRIVSGGNFHGEAIAMAMDFLAIGIAEIASISEQRLMKLTNPHMSGLPAFLVKDSGLNSGFMIPHVAAAALVSENKIYCHPASVDSIPTSAGKEDHVSMGPTAALKAWQVIKNSQTVLAIELIAACQGIDLHTGLKPNKLLSSLHHEVRTIVPFMEKDMYLAPFIEKISQWIGQKGMIENVTQNGFDLL